MSSSDLFETGAADCAKGAGRPPARETSDAAPAGRRPCAEGAGETEAAPRLADTPAEPPPNPLADPLADPLAQAPAEARGSGQSASEPASAELYRTKEVVQILSISRRQLQYWSQTDLVVPSAKTPGGHHRYTFADLVALKATKRLIDAGVSVQRIRSSIQSLRRTLPQVERPLAELTLVATADVVLVFHEGAVFEAVSGQEWVFEVAHFQREVDAWRKLRAPRAVRGSRRTRATRENLSQSA